MSPPAGVMWVDDRDIGPELGLGVVALGSWHGSTRTQRQFAQPFDVAGALAAFSGTKDTRRIPFALAMGGVTHSTRQAALDAVHLWLGGGEVAVRFGDAPDRVMQGICEQISAEGLFGQEFVWEHPALAVTAEFVFADPLRYDRRDRVIGFGSTPTRVDLGPEPSTGEILIMGDSPAVTDPVVIVRRGQSGEEYARLTTSGVSLDTADALRIDLRNHHIYDVQAGTPTQNDDLKPLVTGGTYVSLQPGREGFCTIETDGPDARLLYRRAYP